MPQWCGFGTPTLATGIALDLFTEALAIGTSVAINDKTIVIATRRFRFLCPRRDYMSYSNYNSKF